MPQFISSDIVRTCKVCGDKFHPTARKQFCCNKMKNKICPVCGSTFQVKCTTEYTKTTCSRKCANIYAQQARDESSAKLIRKCKWCGKEFKPTSTRNVYCPGPHYSICVVCGNEFEVDVTHQPVAKTCSTECMIKLQMSHRDLDAERSAQLSVMRDKYGVDNAMQLPHSLDHMKQTNRKKYGVDWYTQTQEYRDSVKSTSMKRYGVEHPLQSEEVKQKRYSTVQETYGVDNVFQSDEIKEKSKQTNLEKYGFEYASQSEQLQKIIRSNNYQKYGVSHPMKLKEFQKKAEETNIRLYGRKAYTQKHIDKIENWYKFINDPESYIHENYEHPPRSSDLATDLGVDTSTIDVYISKHNAYDSIRRAKSLMEESIHAYILSIVPDATIIENDRSVIHPKELDLYLPEYKLAIECDPTVTHNSSTGDPWGGEAKPISYHKEKTDECAKHGVFLFHIFGYDWTNHPEIIYSMLRTLLGVCDNRIYARNCSIREVDSASATEFLNANHRQGNAPAKIKLGLYYQDKLVSLMTFGKMRSTIGTSKSEDLSDCWELVRFCSTLNTSVVGGASKLFKYFIKTHNPSRIRSFSDRAHTKGNLYELLGFQFVRTSDPGYVWVDSRTDISYHRYNTQKRNIQRFLHDNDIDLSKSEKQIMEEHGFVQVFDSGTVLWEWRSDPNL